MKRHSASTRKSVIVFAVVCTLLFSVCGVPAATGVQQVGRRIVFPVRLQWSGQAGIDTYRLQIASDDKFRDILFDGPVRGERYVVDQIEPGSYYWRVAPVQNGPLTFSAPVKFLISGGTLTSFSIKRRNDSSNGDTAGSHSRKKGKQ